MPDSIRRHYRRLGLIAFRPHQSALLSEAMDDVRFVRVPLAMALAKLGARALRVLIAIAAHADREGRAFPSLARIAKLTGIDRRGLHQEIAALVAVGLLRVEARCSKSGDRASNIYTIVFDAGVSPQEATPYRLVARHRVSPIGRPNRPIWNRPKNTRETAREW